MVYASASSKGQIRTPSRQSKYQAAGLIGCRFLFALAPLSGGSHARVKEPRANTTMASPKRLGVLAEQPLVFSPMMVTFSPSCLKHVVKSFETLSSFVYVDGTSHHR